MDRIEEEEEEEEVSPLFGPNLRVREVTPYRFDPSVALASTGRGLSSTGCQASPTSATASASTAGSSSELVEDVEHRPGNVRWCTCEMFKRMERPVDCLCCWENLPAMTMLKQCRRCITEHEDFSVVCLQQ